MFGLARRASVTRSVDVHHPEELALGAENLVDAAADPVEVPVHAGRTLPAAESSCLFYRAGVHGVDADPGECVLQGGVTERAQIGLVRPGDQRQRIAVNH